MCKSKQYENVEIAKEECIGHVQKRVGSRLRSLKEKYKNQDFSDGKKLFGKGRLTEKSINTLQNYYDMAIRQNIGNLYGMKESVAAVLFHCSETTDIANRHKFCPSSSKFLYLQYQRVQLTGENTYKERINIPSAIVKVLKPIFSHADLGNDELLKKCLHGETQNPNESFLNMIWKRCSKRVFVGRTVLETTVTSTIIAFNDGEQGLAGVFEKLGFEKGGHSIAGLNAPILKEFRMQIEKALNR